MTVSAIIDLRQGSRFQGGSRISGGDCTMTGYGMTTASKLTGRSAGSPYLQTLTATFAGVATFLILYILVWTLTAYLSNSGLPADTTEELGWAREWPLGIYRHPPMMVWLLEIAWQVSGHWLGSPYVLSGLALAAGLVFIYALIRIERPATQAGAVVLLTPLVYYFGPQLPQWNANIAQLPFVGLFLYAAWRGVREQSLTFLLLAGAAAGGGVLSKYTFALTVFFAAVFFLVDPVSRSRLKIGSLVASFAVFLLCVSPHVWWFFHAPLNTMGYMEMSLERDTGAWYGHIISPILVILNGIAVLLPTLLFVLFGFDRRAVATDAGRVNDNGMTRYLGFAVLGPVLFAACVGLITGGMVKDQWLIAFLLPAPALLVLYFLPKGCEICWQHRAVPLYLVALAILVAAYPAEREIHYLRSRDGADNWSPLMPGHLLADAAQQTWTKSLAVNGEPERKVPIIAGQMEAAAAASLIPGRPAWLENFETRMSPWISDSMISKNGLLALEPPPAGFVEAHNLCEAGRRDFNWLNGRGRPGQLITITVWLPSGQCRADALK
jgi:4-amino-4-deoxy-L-arabinose transferase-like glycosyltransferase